MARLTKDHHVFSLSASTPAALRVRPGEPFEVETADCFSDQVRGPGDSAADVDWADINPATGPVHVAGAEPGDVLAVTVDSIRVGNRGVMAVGPGIGVLTDGLVDQETRFVELRDGFAELSSDLRVPLRPMIGVLGVAPAGEPVPTGTPGRHGGNMDTTLIGEGATVFLPVAAPGALLAVGDLHAAMGDGEICGTGVEVAGLVGLTAHVRRDLDLGWPVVATPEAIATVASAPTLDEAAEEATRAMAALLSARAGLSLADAALLMSAGGDLQVCQIVDPLRTARFALPRAVVAGLPQDLLVAR